MSRGRAIATGVLLLERRRNFQFLDHQLFSSRGVCVCCGRSQFFVTWVCACGHVSCSEVRAKVSEVAPFVLASVSGVCRFCAKVGVYCERFVKRRQS